MKYYGFLLAIVLIPSLLLSSQAIDKSDNYTQKIFYDFLNYKEEKLEKRFADTLDISFFRVGHLVPIYENRLPLTMYTFDERDLSSIDNDEIRIQGWLLEKTKKLVDCLNFAYLNSPDRLDLVDPEHKYFSELNKVGNDTDLTPGLALIKKINDQFKCIYLRKEKCHGDTSDLEKSLLSWLLLLQKMVPFNFDVHSYTGNYSFSKACCKYPNENLYRSKNNPRAQPSLYLRKWFEDPKKKCLAKIKSEEIKKVLKELYLVSYQSVSGYHFSVGTQPFVPREKFKVTAAYADCDIATIKQDI